MQSNQSHIKELDEFQLELQSKIQGLQHQIVQKLSQGEQQCVQKFQDNENKFVDCMQKLSRKAKNQSKRLEFGLVFWKQSTMECFNKEYNGNRNYQNCKDKQLQLLYKIFSDFQL